MATALPYTPSPIFVTADLPRIEKEFFDATADISFTRDLSRLYPDEAFVKAHPTLHGGYSASAKTLVGLSPSQAAGAGKISCTDGTKTQILDPTYYRLFAGVHEGGHLIADLRFPDKVAALDQKANAMLPGSGVELGLKEDVADVAAIIYLANKYPGDKRLRGFMNDLANARALTSVENGMNAVYSTDKTIRGVLSNLDKRDPEYFKGANITMNDATRMAFEYVDAHLNTAVKNFDQSLKIYEAGKNGTPLADTLAHVKKDALDGMRNQLCIKP